MPFTALLDACVIYPVGLRDTLLTISETGLYRVTWSPNILEEARRNILADLADLPPADLDRSFAAMARAFPDALITGHEALIDAMTNHPKDRHVLAAAVTDGVQVIVTFNLRDFPPESCAPYEIDVQHPDEFLAYALELDPEAVITALAYQAAKRRKPATSLGELLTDLSSALPEFTASVRSELAHIDPGEPWLRDITPADVDIGTAR